MKKIILFLVFGIFLISLVQPVTSFFPKSHIKWSIDGFQQTNSAITNECKNYLDVVMDGNTGSDVGVIYYGSSDKTLLGTYIGTHAKGSGYDSCMKEAGSDVKKRCFCYGNYLHIIQDSFSHNPGGLTETYLKKYFGNNYFGHMAIERDFENKHMKYLTEKGDYIIVSGQLDYYNSNILKTMFELKNNQYYPSDLMLLVNRMAGLDMTSTTQIFQSGYLKEGFYGNVDKYRYNQQTDLPIWFYLVPSGMVLVGLALFIFILILGKNRWKWFTAFTFLIIALLGLLVLYSFNIFDVWSLTGVKIPTWGIITWTLDVVTKMGYLSVSQADVQSYDKIIQDATNKFLECGVDCIKIDDASGLTYKDRFGNIVTGALTQAERPFKIVFYFILIPLYIFLEAWLIFKSLGIKFRRR